MLPAVAQRTAQLLQHLSSVVDGAPTAQNCISMSSVSAQTTAPGNTAAAASTVTRSPTLQQHFSTLLQQGKRPGTLIFFLHIFTRVFSNMLQPLNG